MKRFLVSLVTISLIINVFSQEKLEYYLPVKTQYNPKVPSPESTFGFQIGEFHLTHDKIVRYMEVLDRTSDRVSLITTGYTYEKQPLLLVVITSPENQQNLEKLRKDHLASIDPASSTGAIRKDPTVVWLGYSVHGNEPSGANAAPLVAYYLAAGENDEIKKMMDQTIFLIDPVLNPDGFNRFATYVNSRKSLHNNPDNNSMEFNEPWPGSRSNHYWFDLNRDWLMLRHPESRARLNQFHLWKPHILTDHHEMGSSSTFFFQPGVESRSNPIVPKSNFSLTQKIGMYHASALDEIGSLYFTEENFDDFFFGKGSSYPDVNGSIGILFEQASSRGHLQNTSTGPMSFAFTIRNQVQVSLSTIKASQELARELKYNQAEFNRSALVEAENSTVKGYLFGDSFDPWRTQMMIDILRQHQIKMYGLKKAIDLEGMHFDPGSAYVIPTKQVQYRLIKALFEKVTHFSDSTFYDVSAWTIPLAMGVPYSSIDAKNWPRVSLDNELISSQSVSGELIGGESSVGYLFDCTPYMVHQGIYELLDEELSVRIAKQPFTMVLYDQIIRFNSGTIFVPVQSQPMGSVDLYQFMGQLASNYGLKVYSSPTGYSPEGPDLGSGQNSLLVKPTILTLVGEGMNSGDVGQLWYLLDTQFNIPITLMDVDLFDRANLSNYNTLILGSGSYSSLQDASSKKLSDWVRAGGTLIALESAGSFLSRIGLLDIEEKRAEPEDQKTVALPYQRQSTDRIGSRIPGTIFEAHLDTTHPLGYGYHTDFMPLFKTGNSSYLPNSNPYENPVIYVKSPLLSGYVPQKQLLQIAESSGVQRQRNGRGTVIWFVDDPNFRGYWAAEHKLLMNAIFFGGL